MQMSRDNIIPEPLLFQLQIQSSRFTDVILGFGLNLITKKAAWTPERNDLPQVGS